MQTRQAITTSLAFLILSASGLAMAGPEKTKTKDKDILRGPKVVHTDQSVRNSTDADDSSMDSMDSQDAIDTKAHPIQFREYLMALRQLHANQGGEPLNLSAEQQDQIKSIMQQHRKAMKEFQEANREKMRELRNSSNPGAGAREKQSTDDRPAIQSRQARDRRDKESGNQDRALKGHAKDRAEKAKNRLREFIDSAPPNRQAISKLMQVLTPEQQQILKSNVRNARKHRIERAKQARQNHSERAQDRRGNDSEATPGNRRHINADRAKNKGKRDAQRSKTDDPKSDDD